MIIAIGTMGGVGEPLDWTSGCESACQKGLSELQNARTAIHAVVEAVAHMENDGRFNAGRGAAVHKGTITQRNPIGVVALDAGVMYSTMESSRCGSVSGLSVVYSAVKVARELMNRKLATTLWGEHADRFALGLQLERRTEISPEARQRYDEMVNGFNTNFYLNPPKETVGAVAMDPRGRFAAALSSGCYATMPEGRMGDAAMPGCGFFAGPDGAVVFTGIGDEIKRRTAASEVYYRWLANFSAQEACDRAIRLFPPSIPVGVLAINGSGLGVKANRTLPHALLKQA